MSRAALQDSKSSSASLADKGHGRVVEIGAKNKTNGCNMNSGTAQMKSAKTSEGTVGDSERSIDQKLVERVQRGDKRAFDMLVTKYQHRLVSLVMRFVKDPDDAKDVSQEAFIKAYRALPNFRGDSAFYTWLYRIAINTAKNHLVARGRRQADTHLDIEDAASLEAAEGLRELASPERHMMRDEIQQAVYKALRDLPEDLRTAVTLREFDGLSYEEIAAVMDCPIGTVRSRIFRGREAIDKTIEPLVV